MAWKRRRSWGVRASVHFLKTTFLILSGPGAFIRLSFLMHLSICLVVISPGSDTGVGYVYPSKVGGDVGGDVGGGGKKAFASTLLFASLVFAWVGRLSESLEFSVGILVRLPSEGSELRYLFAIQISSPLMFSSQSNQWSCLVCLIISEYLFCWILCCLCEG